MAIFKFTVYRDSWFRGKSWEDSKLSALYPGEDGRSQRMGCCLGHALCDIGVDFKIFDNLGEFCEFTTDHNFDKSEYPEFSRLIEIETEAIYCNDDETISDSDREEKLKKLFNENDIEVEFVDGRRSW